MAKDMDGVVYHLRSGFERINDMLNDAQAELDDVDEMLSASQTNAMLSDLSDMAHSIEVLAQTVARINLPI